MEQDRPPKTGRHTEILGLLLFWVLWLMALGILPFYFFGTIFEADAVEKAKLLTYLSPIVGSVSVLLQIALLVYSVVLLRRPDEPIAKAVLSLFAGGLVLFFVFAGGCALMGPLSI